MVRLANCLFTSIIVEPRRSSVEEARRPPDDSESYHRDKVRDPTDGDSCSTLGLKTAISLYSL